VEVSARFRSEEILSDSSALLAFGRRKDMRDVADMVGGRRPWQPPPISSSILSDSIRGLTF
jgi:hypothetical protein